MGWSIWTVFRWSIWTGAGGQFKPAKCGQFDRFLQAYWWILKKPESFRSTANALYMNDKTEINGFEIEPDYESTQMDPTADKKSTHYGYKFEELDWMMQVSIQNSQNWWDDYVGLKSENDDDGRHKGGNSTSDEIDLMSNLLGAKVKQQNYSGGLTNPKDFITQANERVSNGQAEIWNIDAALLNNVGYNFKSAGEMNHAVAFTGGSFRYDEGSNQYLYSFTLISFGESKMFTDVTEEEFSKNVFGTTYTTDLE